MEYILSKKNDSIKKKYEEIIAQNNKKYLKLGEEIKNIRTRKEGTIQDRQFAILELQIRQEEIERDTVEKERYIASLYIIEMEENLIQRRKNKEISAQEYVNEQQNIIEYRTMITTKDTIKDYDNEAIILDMKLKLEYMKKSMGKVSKEQADKNISEIQKNLTDNELEQQSQEKYMTVQSFEYKKRNLYYQRNDGQISTEELNQKLEEIKHNKGNLPTEKEFEEILNNLANKHLEKAQQSQEYNEKISSRDHINIASKLEQDKKQNINKRHENSIYQPVQEYNNKTFKYGLNVPEGQDYIEYVGRKLGEDYIRGTKGEKAELAQQFAKLEVQGTFGEFKNPYDYNHTVSGYDNPKLLLQLEKINGLNIEELENIIGLDTSVFHQNIYVATYEIEEWDRTSQKKVMKPIKEYYQKNENGDMTIIGTGTEKRTTITVDDLKFDISPEQIIQGESLEKVTQQEMGDKLIKNSIEDSMKNGRVTEVAAITDMNFLKDFSEQCGIPESWDLNGRTFIVSTINEKGEEDFDIIIRSDNPGEVMDTTYKSLEGIQKTGKQGREMYTTTGNVVAGNLKQIYKTPSLKEFVTKSGNRYAITRNKEGKLGFNEIFRENENIIQAEHIDTYTYSTNEYLQRTYENAEVSQEDLEKAYETINRTKAEREQTQDKTHNFGRS